MPKPPKPFKTELAKQAERPIILDAPTAAAIHLDLPLPPSINHYWRHRIAGRVGKQFIQIYVSEEGQDFIRKVDRMVLEQIGFHRPTLERVRVLIQISYRDRRAIDLDNRVKPLFDALTQAGIWKDDEQVDDFRVVRGPIIVPDGGCRVSIEPIREKTLFD